MWTFSEKTCGKRGSYFQAEKGAHTQCSQLSVWSYCHRTLARCQDRIANGSSHAAAWLHGIYLDTKEEPKTQEIQQSCFPTYTAAQMSMSVQWGQTFNLASSSNWWARHNSRHTAAYSMGTASLGNFRTSASFQTASERQVPMWA